MLIQQYADDSNHWKWWVFVCFGFHQPEQSNMKFDAGDYVGDIIGIKWSASPEISKQEFQQEFHDKYEIFWDINSFFLICDILLTSFDTVVEHIFTLSLV